MRSHASDPPIKLTEYDLMKNKSIQWQLISRDPNCEEVRLFLESKLGESFEGCFNYDLDFLRDFVRDQSVLDIGVVAHTLERTFSPQWKHEVIRRHANTLVGIDILEEPVENLSSRGYDVRLVDATGNADLGMRFSRVVIGDVIEHVDDPVALLKFARRHLTPDGQILCSTPNPFFLGHVIAGFRSKWFIPNADHVRWISPTMAVELGGRAGLSLFKFWHLRGIGITRTKRIAVKTIEALGIGDKEMFASSFYFVFRPCA